jgi:hypothetical protein
MESCPARGSTNRKQQPDGEEQSAKQNAQHVRDEHRDQPIPASIIAPEVSWLRQYDGHDPDRHDFEHEPGDQTKHRDVRVDLYQGKSVRSSRLLAFNIPHLHIV